VSVRRGHDLQETEDQTTEAEPEAETFPRSYVENLRQENGKYRQRAQKGRRDHGLDQPQATSPAADPLAKSDKERHPRRLMLTSPQSCGNEPDNGGDLQ
jgi:hypothetical protein